LRELIALTEAIKKNKYCGTGDMGAIGATFAVLVKNNSAKADQEDYYGINVLFNKSGKVAASIADDESQKQWDTDKVAITAAARAEGGASLEKFLRSKVAEGKHLGVKMGGVSTERPEFGFEDRLNAQKAEAELKDAGIEYKRHENFGIFYFVFPDGASIRKAVRLVKPVIDRSEESEW